MKRIFSVLLALAMLLSVVSAMAEGQTEYTIIGGQSALSPGYKDNVILNQLQEETGISINWNTMSDSLSEQVNIHIAGGDLPDAFLGVGFNNYNLATYGEDGTFIDLTPYLNADVMPNLTAILEEHPEFRAAITQADGCIYGLPSGDQMTTAGIGKEKDYNIGAIPQFSMINKVWLDDLGLAMPTTLDELHDVLVAFKENDMAAKIYGAAAGSTIPMSTGFDQWCWGQNIFYAGFGFTNYPTDVGIADLVLDPGGTANFVCDDDKYRAAVTYFHDWYAEGLMDIEMFSQDTTQLMAKCQQGWVGVSTWWYIEELMGDYAKDYVFLPVLDGPNGDHYVNIRTGGAITSGQLSITEACKDPTNLLKFFDKWYDGKTVMQLQYGPYGVYFIGEDEDGAWIALSEEQGREMFGKSPGELKGEYEVWGPKLILAEYYRDVAKMEPRAVDRLEDLYNFWIPIVTDDTAFPCDCTYTLDELEVIDRYRADFESAVSEQEGLWIKNGGPTDDEWEAYKKMLNNNCGMDKLLEVYQNTYDRYAAAEK